MVLQGKHLRILHAGLVDDSGVYSNMRWEVTLHTTNFAFTSSMLETDTKNLPIS